MVQLKLTKPVHVAGFYLPKKSVGDDGKQEEDENNNKEESSEPNKKEEEEEVEKVEVEEEEEEEEEEDDEDEDEEDDEEGGEWITPGNLDEIKKLSMVDSDQSQLGENNKIKVGCMTSDFAMQVIA